MTQNNNPTDPFNAFGGLINGVLGSALGDAAKGKPVNPVVDAFFSKAETLIRDASAAANAPRPRPEAFPKPAPAAQKAPQAAPTDSAPKTEAPKEDAPKHVADEVPFGGIDLPSVIEDVVAFGQGTFHGLSNMLGFGDQGATPFAGPDFIHVFKANTAPPVDILSRENSVEYRFAVAGVKPENVSVELDAEILTVTINTPKNAPVTEDGKIVASYLVQEIWSGNWSSEFAVPAVNKDGHKVEIDEENVKATVKDGLVSVLVPFKERIKTKISVS